MAGSTLPAERASTRRRVWSSIGVAVLLLVGMLGSCQLFQPSEPHASRDVLDAIYAGIKRAQDHPG